MQHLMDVLFRAAILLGWLYVIARVADIAARVIRSWLRGKQLKQIKSRGGE